MALLNHIQLMANYNQWMNRKVYETASVLPEDALKADKKAFFGSIFGTLNHLMIGDTIWLKRLSAHPASHPTLNDFRTMTLPASLGEPLHDTFAALRVAREALDVLIIAWCAELTEADLAHSLHYTTMNGQSAEKHFGSLVLHLFNHQTHHRGQVTTLLSQAGLDVGVTDLLALIPDDSAT